MGEWYRAGTVSVTNGSPNVVGVGTLWMSQASVGDIFLGPDLVEYEISSITDDTHLALKQINGTAAYAGTTNSAQVYAIIRNFTSTLPAQLASQLAELMTTYHVTLDELTAWLSGTGTVTLHDAVGNSYSVQTPAAMNAVLTGRLVKSVAGGADVTLTAAEAANLFIELTGTLTANINVILPAGVRHNFILNNTSGAYTVTVKTAAGTGVVVTQGKRGLLECDGTNVVSALTALLGISAADLANTPAGNLAATTVQAAINELDAEKASSGYVDTQIAMNKNGLALAQAVELTAAASGSTGITVPYSAAWALGTNNFALHVKFALPDWTPAAATVIALIRVDGSNIIWWYVDTDGKLGIYAYIAGVYVIPASKSTVATGLADGTMADIEIDVVRESVSVAGSVTFRVNGVTLGAPVALAAATPASLTLSSPLYFGGTSTSRSAGTWQTCHLYNRALSDADARALFQKGVAFEDKGASSNLVINGDFATGDGTGGWHASVGSSTETISYTANTMLITCTAAGSVYIGSSSLNVVAGRRYRLTAQVVQNTSGVAVVAKYGSAGGYGAITASSGVSSLSGAGTLDFYFTAAVTDVVYLGSLFASIGQIIELDNVVMPCFGAAVMLEPEGIQPTGQWLDASGNGNHAAFPASGASLTRLMDRGMYRWTTPITGDTTLTSIVPAGFELDKIVFNNSTANTVSVRLGTTAGGVDVFGLTALNTSATLGGFKTLACNQAFSLTAAQTLYLSSTSWNSASLTATFYFRRVAP